MMGSPGEDPEAVDPVCGEIFPPDLAVFQSEHHGDAVYFCSKTCKEHFDADPGAYTLSDPSQQAEEENA